MRKAPKDTRKELGDTRRAHVDGWGAWLPALSPEASGPRDLGRTPDGRGANALQREHALGTPLNPLPSLSMTACTLAVSATEAGDPSAASPETPEHYGDGAGATETVP